jgi:hypothetical protein
MIAGVPASGKTTFGKLFINDESDIYDDPKEIPPVEEIVNKVLIGKNVVIADPNFTRTEFRESANRKFKKIKDRIHWVHMVGYADVCTENALERNSNRENPDFKIVTEAISYMCKQYNMSTMLHNLEGQIDHEDHNEHFVNVRDWYNYSSYTKHNEHIGSK